MNEEKAASEGYVSGSLTSKIRHHRMAVLVEENIVTEKEKTLCEFHQDLRSGHHFLTTKVECTDSDALGCWFREGNYKMWSWSSSYWPCEEFLPTGTI